jgi:hypothetical protein
VNTTQIHKIIQWDVIDISSRETIKCCGLKNDKTCIEPARFKKNNKCYCTKHAKKECFIGLIEEQNDFTKDIKREKELHRAASMALDFFWNLESLSERILEKPELSPLSFFQVYFERTLKAYPKQFSDSLILTGVDAS